VEIVEATDYSLLVDPPIRLSGVGTEYSSPPEECIPIRTYAEFMKLIPPLAKPESR